MKSRSFLPLPPALAAAILGAILSFASPHSARADIHLQIAFSGGDWDLYILDLESGRSDPAEIAFPVALAARSQIPDDPAYSFLGRPGWSVWVLPQNEMPGVLSLGIGTSSIAPGLFANNQIRLALHRVEGPGALALFTPSPFGAPAAHMTSFDGVDPATDAISIPAIAGHLHLNWAFTVPGIYRLGFAASGIVRSTGELLQSPVVDYTFIVEAPPPPKLLNPRLQPDGTFSLTFHAETPGLYEIQTSAELKTWLTATNLNIPRGVRTILLPGAQTPASFFRATMR